MAGSLSLTNCWMTATICAVDGCEEPLQYVDVVELLRGREGGEVGGVLGATVLHEPEAPVDGQGDDAHEDHHGDGEDDEHGSLFAVTSPANAPDAGDAALRGADHEYLAVALAVMDRLWMNGTKATGVVVIVTTTTFKLVPAVVVWVGGSVTLT